MFVSVLDTMLEFLIYIYIYKEQEQEQEQEFKTIFFVIHFKKVKLDLFIFFKPNSAFSKIKRRKKKDLRCYGK